MVDECRDHVVAVWQRVVYTIWRGETTSRGVHAMQDAVRRLRDGRALALSIVTETAPLPPASVRRALAETMARFGDQIARSALVFEGGGFRAAAVRSVVTGLSLFSKLPYPHRVFDKPEVALGWLHEVAKVEPTLHFSLVQSLDALHALRERKVQESLSSAM